MISRSIKKCSFISTWKRHSPQTDGECFPSIALLLSFTQPALLKIIQISIFKIFHGQAFSRLVNQ